MTPPKRNPGRRLQDLLYQVPLLEMQGRRDLLVPEVHFDSRRVGTGDVFVAVPGTQVDGHRFINQAVGQGAAVVVAEALPEALDPNVTYIRVKDSATALAFLCANYYGNPAQELKMVGVTGTNGKTTVSTLLYRLFEYLGYPSGLISTISIYVHQTGYHATHTTPDPKSIHEALRLMVDAGCSYCFMETSSHALDQRRVAGIPFAGGVFTNITHDHLDYHGTFDNYLNAKQLLFNNLAPGAFALTNVDDRHGQVMVQNTRARVRSYSLDRPADYKGRVLEQRLDGQLLDLMGREVWTSLSGRFNAYNLLAVVAAAVELGVPPDEVLLQASRLTAVQGRFQLITLPGKRAGVVDYAHTPDGLHKVLQTLQDIRPEGGRLIAVVGCGGERDRAKRPVMAKLAAEACELVILTSDNPRNEDPERILDDMQAGVPPHLRGRVRRLVDRRAAIRTAAEASLPGDVLLVAGKGHETVQIIGNERHPFDDAAELRAAFADVDPGSEPDDNPTQPPHTNT